MEYLEKEIDSIYDDLGYLKNKINTIKYSNSRYFTNFLNSCNAKDYLLYSFLEFYNNCVLSEEIFKKQPKKSEINNYQYNVPIGNRFSLLENKNMSY